MIALVSEIVAASETHASLDGLFADAGAPGVPPSGSKSVKAQAWLRRVNRDESIDPLKVVGRILEPYMEAKLSERDGGHENLKRQARIEGALARAELRYMRGGLVAGVLGPPSPTLGELTGRRDQTAIDEEFARVLRSTEERPKEAVTAACDILESVFRTHIQDAGLAMPGRRGLQPAWSVLRQLRFNPRTAEDRDFEEVLGGLVATVRGIAAFAATGRSARGAAGKHDLLEPRHARLAIHAAYTVAAFVLESWDTERET